MSKKSDFKISTRIGGGRFSDVSKCTKISTGQQYALKLIEPDDERPPHNARNELKILQRLNDNNHDYSNPSGEFKNKNVVPLIDYFINSMEIGFVLPLYQTNLTELIKSRCKTRSHFGIDGKITKRTQNNLKKDEIKHIFKGVFNALKFIHSQDIIHRDINPNNIMFLNQGDELSLDPVLIDFGISFQKPDNFGGEPYNDKITDIATGYYKAPELLLTIRDYDETVDIWATGVMLMLMIY
ncbi:unnamed protein product [Ambrosiozyma monospora]|uniref:Unnamed protein product n=1 Tax=Ambrosiozyma monospora TaxID=43982 RepID=A0ACB5TA83_AMBMO|nr:unnamed protein product [Ambrosiozyma monospora]